MLLDMFTDIPKLVSLFTRVVALNSAWFLVSPRISTSSIHSQWSHWWLFNQVRMGLLNLLAHHGYEAQPNGIATAWYAWFWTFIRTHL